ncbi:MAG TPA: hypothetical protein VMU47_11005 [Caldimonas sp.]|nr:hypothetical protein [Caldimonas sp.]
MTEEIVVDVQEQEAAAPVKAQGETYFGNVLSAIERGAQMDLRVHIAVDIVKSPIIQEFAGQKLTNMGYIETGELAAFALDLADQLVSQAASRGWVKPMPETGDIPASLKRHIERSVSAGLHQALEQNRAARDHSPMGLATPGGMMMPGRAN